MLIFVTLFLFNFWDPCEQTTIQVMCRSTCKKCDDPNAEVYHKSILYWGYIYLRWIGYLYESICILEKQLPAYESQVEGPGLQSPMSIWLKRSAPWPTCIARTTLSLPYPTHGLGQVRKIMSFNIMTPPTKMTNGMLRVYSKMTIALLINEDVRTFIGSFAALNGHRSSLSCI